MPRVDPDVLGSAEPVFLAATLAEAKQVEDLLTGQGVNYAVHVEMYGRTLLGSPRHGAVFSVDAAQADYCRSYLTAAGLERGVL